MIQPRYIVRVPSMDEHRRWVDERTAKVTQADKTRRRRRPR